MKYSRNSDRYRSPHLNEEQQDLMREGIRYNTKLLGLIMGTGVGLFIFLFTHLSILVTGEQSGHYLNLLGIIFPGYTASATGAWFGLLWGFVFGALSGGFIYYVYARTSLSQLKETMVLSNSKRSVVDYPTLRLSGHALGIALGTLMALQLFLATVWLIIRGTAHQSPHAALLVNYFPGYSVSYSGALIGATFSFAYSYLIAHILAGTYNGLVSRRNRRSV